MHSRNVDVHRSNHEAFSRGDLDAVVFGESIRFTDHARGLVLEGQDEVKGWLEEWKQAFSDARITDADYVDAGEYSVCRFTGRGVNDGPLGPFSATGREVVFPLCEVHRHDAAGRVIEGNIYYDQLTILIQLGHAPAPERATIG